MCFNIFGTSARVNNHHPLQRDCSLDSKKQPGQPSRRRRRGGTRPRGVVSGKSPHAIQEFPLTVIRMPRCPQLVGSSPLNQNVFVIILFYIYLIFEFGGDRRQKTDPAGPARTPPHPNPHKHISAQAGNGKSRTTRPAPAPVALPSRAVGAVGHGPWAMGARHLLKFSSPQYIKKSALDDLSPNGINIYLCLGGFLVCSKGDLE